MLPEGNKLNLLRDQRECESIDACSADVTAPAAKVTALRMQHYASIYNCTGVIVVVLVLVDTIGNSQSVAFLIVSNSYLLIVAAL